MGFGYWSHDIGGHIPGPVAPELYTRWIQFGIFSPILRTHTTKNANAERRIWAYPPEFADAMRDAFQLRYAMIPYIYTAARRAYDSGVSMVHPLYYDWPDADQAYAFPDEYRFGEDLVVSPVVAADGQRERPGEPAAVAPAGRLGGVVQRSTAARSAGAGPHVRARRAAGVRARRRDPAGAAQDGAERRAARGSAHPGRVPG